MAALLSYDDRFAKAKALQADLNSKSPPKLEILCFDFFISIAENIISEWQKSGENACDQLPDILRTGMLNYLLSEAHKLDGNNDHITEHLYELSCMLMNETTLKLDYEDCSSYTNWLSNTAYDAFGEILASAAVKCPKLKHLAFHDCKKFKIITPIIFGTKNAMTLGSGIDHLLQLEGLRHLDILGLWFWTEEGLNKLFSQLKKLITLKILIQSNASVSGIQKLKELEEFHFVVGHDPDYHTNSVSNSLTLDYELIYSYCAQNVPSLKLIGAPTNDCADENNFYYYSDLRHITPKIVGTSKLKHLHTTSKLPAAEFPNLQHLHFFGPISSDAEDKFFQKFGTFTHLTTLNLGHLTSEVIAKMLELVGKQLNALSINLRENQEPGDLFQILHLCPNLVTFLENGCFVLRGDPLSKYEALVTEHNVRLIEHFQANFYGIHEEMNRLFELLLFAPLMQDLRLTSISMTKTSCQLLNDVEEGKLRKLRCFIVSRLQLDPPCSMDDFDLFVQCLVCSAPSLNYFDFTLRELRGCLAWAIKKWDRDEITTAARSFQKLVNKDQKTGFPRLARRAEYFEFGDTGVKIFQGGYRRPIISKSNEPRIRQVLS